MLRSLFEICACAPVLVRAWRVSLPLSRLALRRDSASFQPTAANAQRHAHLATSTATSSSSATAHTITEQKAAAKAAAKADSRRTRDGKQNPKPKPVPVPVTNKTPTTSTATSLLNEANAKADALDDVHTEIEKQDEKQDHDEAAAAAAAGAAAAAPSPSGLLTQEVGSRLLPRHLKPNSAPQSARLTRPKRTHPKLTRSKHKTDQTSEADRKEQENAAAQPIASTEAQHEKTTAQGEGESQSTRLASDDPIRPSSLPLPEFNIRSLVRHIYTFLPRPPELTRQAEIEAQEAKRSEAEMKNARKRIRNRKRTSKQRLTPPNLERTSSASDCKTLSTDSARPESTLTPDPGALALLREHSVVGRFTDRFPASGTMRIYDVSAHCAHHDFILCIAVASRRQMSYLASAIHEFALSKEACKRNPKMLSNNARGRTDWCQVEIGECLVHIFNRAVAPESYRREFPGLVSQEEWQEMQAQKQAQAKAKEAVKKAERFAEAKRIWQEKQAEREALRGTPDHADPKKQKRQKRKEPRHEEALTDDEAQAESKSDSELNSASAQESEEDFDPQLWSAQRLAREEEQIKKAKQAAYDQAEDDVDKTPESTSKDSLSRLGNDREPQPLPVVQLSGSLGGLSAGFALKFDQMAEEARLNTISQSGLAQDSEPESPEAEAEAEAEARDAQSGLSPPSSCASFGSDSLDLFSTVTSTRHGSTISSRGGESSKSSAGGEEESQLAGSDPDAQAEAQAEAEAEADADSSSSASSAPCSVLSHPVMQILEEVYNSDESQLHCCVPLDRHLQLKDRRERERGKSHKRSIHPAVFAVN